MNHAVPVLRPAFPAPFEHSPASPHGARRGGSPPPPRRSFSFSHSRLSGASPLAVLASAAAPPMSPACFLTGDALSASLSGVEPKAQKPIRSASKSLGQKAPSSWAVGPTDTGRALSAPGGPRAAGDFLSGGCSLEGAKAKTDLRGASDDEALNLTATNPSSRKATHDRTAADMSSKSYRTVDPWASFDASGRLRGGRATGDGKAPWQEPQKTWGAKGQPAGPATSFYRGRSEGTDVPAADAPNYPYVARPSNESCSTAASYYYYGDAPKAGAASWGRLQLSDGIRYASASLGKSFSGTEVPAAPLPHAEGPAGLHASASLGADFFRSTAEPLGAVGASAVVPAVPHYPYSLADPALSMATPIFQSVHYSQPYLSSSLARGIEEGVRGSPVVGTINGFAYPGGCDGAASSAGALSGAPVVTSRVTTTRRLPAVPVAPLDSSCLLSSDPRHDSRPAVKLSPVRNVTSGVAASGPQVSPVEPLEPVCPPVAQAPAEAAPASPSPSASPVPEKALSAAGSSLQSTDASSDPLATFGERAARVGKALSRREERSRNEVEESLDERSLADESQSPASAVPLSARVHLCCGVLARLMMRPAGSLCLGSPTAGGSLARLPFASAAFHSFPSLSGDRPREERSSTLGICSVLLETTAKPSNRRRLLSRPMRLIHVNRWDGREVLTVDEQARNFLNDLGTQPVAVISVCGVVQTGKSALTNLLLDETHMLSPSGFPVGTPAKLEGEKNPASISLGAGAGGRHSYDAPQAGSGHGMREEDEFDGVEEATEAGKRFGKRSVHDGCTDGVWIQAVASAAGGHEGKDDITFLVLDFEGVGCTRKTVEHDQRLFTLAMLVSHYLIYNTRGVLDADAISSLAAVSMWTQKLVHSSSCDAMRDSPGSRAGSSRLSPRAGGSPSHAHGGPSVPSGWRAPSLLWTLQDFNYTLFDEDEYPLTEDDYLEAVVATATRPVPCCFPFSSSFALGSGACASSRVCAELNLPHIRMLRQQLATLFTERACLAFPHPMGDYAPADLFVDGLASGDQTPSAANLVGGGCDFLAAGDCGGSSRATVGALLSRAGAGNSSFASSFPAVSRKAGGEAAGEASPSRQGSGRVGRRRSSSQFTFFDAPAPRGSAFFSASSPPIAGAETQRESGCGVAQFDGRQSVLETVPVADFQPIYRRRLQQAKNLVFKECRLRAAQEVPTTGASFAKVLQKIIDGINDGEVPEGSSVVVGVQKEECRQWKEKCEQNFMAELRAAFQSRLPISNRELQEGALALQKKALALFKMHIIGDDDVVRSYKQQLKDRLRKITDRAIEENERHGEWKARSRLRGVRERLNIDEKLNERLYDSMAQVNDDVERLKQEFNADLRGPSHVFERMLNDQIDELLAKGSEIVCESLLDQSRQAERAVSELQRKAEEAELTLERTHELQQKLQTRDYEAEQLRRALEEERARRLSTGSGFSEYEDEFGRYRTRRSTSRRRGRSRIGVSSQSKCLGQKKCTIM